MLKPSPGNLPQVIKPAVDPLRILIGGNSNWQGPIWFPINFLIIESLQKFHHYQGDSLKVEFPTRSGNFLNLRDVSMELSKRLIKLFVRDGQGKRLMYGGMEKFSEDPHWKDLFLFNEYFHGMEPALAPATKPDGRLS